MGQKAGYCRESKKKKKKKTKKQAAMSKYGIFLRIALLCSLLSLCIAKPRHFLIETEAAADEHGSGQMNLKRDECGDCGDYGDC